MIFLLGIAAIVETYARPGELDSAFGDSGRVFIDPSMNTGQSMVVNDLILTPDDLMVAAASGQSANIHHAILARFFANGTLDPVHAPQVATSRGRHSN